MLSPYQVLCDDIDGSGVQCKCKKINKEVGFKFLSTEGDARKVYNNHLILEKIGYGPKILSGIFPFKTLEHTHYGFLVEHCVTLKEIANDCPYSSRVLLNKIYDLISTLEGEMVERGFHSGDPHLGNFGIAQNGQFICIDSGYISPIE